MTPHRAFRSPAATTQFGGPGGRTPGCSASRPAAAAMLAALPYGTGLLAGLAASAARYPEVVAVTGPGERMTYGRCGHDRCAGRRAACARTLRGHHSRCAVPHSPMFVRALIASAKLGATVVLLQHRDERPTARRCGRGPIDHGGAR